MVILPAQQMVHTLAWGMPMGGEWLVIGALGLLIFGKRLPEVGKGIGSAIRSFKKGLNEAEAEPLEEEVPVAKRLTDAAARPSTSSTPTPASRSKSRSRSSTRTPASRSRKRSRWRRRERIAVAIVVKS